MQPASVVVINTILSEFIPQRNFTLTSASNMSNDKIIENMIHSGYIKIEAKNNNPRGDRDEIIIYVLHTDGKYFHHSPDLRKLVDNVNLNILDELIIIAEEEFFGKKNLMDVINLKSPKSITYDPKGDFPYYNAYPYYNFVINVLKHQSVPEHRIMSNEEVETLLKNNYKNIKDLPIIFDIDPPIIWIGAKDGQVIEIIRTSQCAMNALYYRRVVKSIVKIL